MSSQETRAELVSKLLSKLVREITQVKDERKLQSLEQLAFSVIRNHRSISINRYEVRRKLDDLKEKFIVDNFKEYADHLERLCNVVLNHPVCLQHYEVDIQWSLLELLFSLAYNPTGSLRRNQHKIVIESPEKTKENTFAKLEDLYLKSILREDFIPVQSFEENSDLSDWSGSEAEAENEETQEQINICEEIESNSCSKPVLLTPLLPALQPPMKQASYQLVEDKPDLRLQLKESVQNGWWLLTEENEIQQQISKRMESNFAALLANYVRKHTNGFMHFREPSIVTEFCLLRELLWVFYLPQKSKFFSITSGKCKLQKDVTVPSISAPTLTAYLEHNILPLVDQMHSLRNFLRNVYDCQDQKLPRTFEYYAANLKGLVDPILDTFVKLEERIVKQENLEINTLITFQSSLKDTFEQLQMIYAVHEAVVLDYRKHPAHITSAFLLTALMRFSNAATNTRESNLAISLFLASIKAFCNIIDSWWNDGRLDDWQQEFLVECSSDQSISFRLYSKDEERAFFVPKSISKIITENRFMHLLQEHSMEAGYTLNLLYEISRIGDLKNECGAVGDKLYDIFIDDVFRQIRRIAFKNDVDCADTVKGDMPDSIVQRQSNKNGYENLTTNDEFLLLLFDTAENNTRKEESYSRDVCDAVDDTNAWKNSALNMFNKLEQFKQMLPLEELILSSFGRILRERITYANKFVVDLYRGNVNILQHLRNIRKVLLLEASDVMQPFYIKLFKQMEAGQPWANAFVLTIQLDDTISGKHPEMSSLFRIELNSAARVQTLKVTEAVEALTINYSFSNELAKIITEEDMRVYNEVFRFLLKVKWGLATLENLKFSRAPKRPPYTPLEMGDFLMRRLEQLRFWMFYGVQCVHSHLMMHVLQAMGTQLEEKLLQSTNVREMETVHKSYLATISEHCFLKDNLSRIKFGIEQLLNLVFVLRLEWRSCLKHLDQCTPLAADISQDSDDLEAEDYAITAEIDTIELTYIRCHQYLANMLNNEVYINQNSFLSGLSAAFNTSLPC